MRDGIDITETEWHQMTEDEQRRHEEEISKEDWAEYDKWLDRERPWWMFIEQEESWLKNVANR